MLIFLLTEEAPYTIESYLAQWAPEFRDFIRVQTYEDLARSGSLEPGTYVFGDQERWTPRARQLGIELWNQLARAGPTLVPLNNPHRVILRYELLRGLHANGQNRFNVYHPIEALWRSRFPAFLHSTDKHEGPISPLLSGRYALLKRLHRLRRQPWNNLLVEEFCDVATPGGLYSKYGAFHMAGEIVPRHLFFGKNWALKDTEILGKEEALQFENYLRDNPHKKKLREIFAFAGIDFGRIDYAFCEGQLQVWEINTNPMIIGSIEGALPLEISLIEMFREQVKPHFRRLSALHQPGAPLSYNLSGTFRAEKNGAGPEPLVQ